MGSSLNFLIANQILVTISYCRSQVKRVHDKRFAGSVLVFAICKDYLGLYGSPTVSQFRYQRSCRL